TNMYPYKTLLRELGAVASHLLPGTVLPDKRISRQNRSSTTVAVVQRIIGAFVSSDRRVAVNAHTDLRNYFTVRLVVLAVLHIGQDGLFRFPVPPTRAARKVFGVVLLNKGQIAGEIRLHRRILHLCDRSYGSCISSCAVGPAERCCWECRNRQNYRKNYKCISRKTHA